MNVAEIHELVRDLNFDTFGVEITILPTGLLPDRRTFPLEGTGRTFPLRWSDRTFPLVSAGVSDALETTGIWMTPPTEGMPASGSRTIRRKEAIKCLAIKAADAEGLNKELSRITAPDGPGGTVRTFRLDGPSEIFSDHTRFTVVVDTESEDA